MGIKNEKYRKICKFSDLVVWQEGHKLVLVIYKMVNSLPSSERFSLADQVKRAVVSFTYNIAEGFAKRSSKDKNRFYNIARLR